jgi:hypothetical protein
VLAHLLGLCTTPHAQRAQAHHECNGLVFKEGFVCFFHGFKLGDVLYVLCDSRA